MDRPPSGRTLFARHPLALLAASRAISVLGSGLGRVSLAFAILRLPHGGPLLLSEVAACQAAPQLGLVLFGGEIADRFSRRTVMVWAELLGAAAWSMLFIGFLSGSFPPGAYCALACCTGVASALLAPALNGAIADLSGAGQLQQSNSMVRASQNTAAVLGLALGGVSVTLIGTAWTVGLNALSFVLSAGMLAAIRVPNPARRQQESFFSGLRTGWAEFSSRSWLWATAIHYAFVVAAINAFLAVLGPLAAERAFGGARAWSLLVACLVLGTVAGAMLAARLRPAHSLRLGVASMILMAAPMLSIAAGAPLWADCGLMLLSGVATDIFGVLWTTTLQEQVDNSALARVSSYDLLASLTLALLALLIAGPAASAFGLTRTLLGCAVIIVVSTVITLNVRSVRALEAGSERRPQLVAARCERTTCNAPSASSSSGGTPTPARLNRAPGAARSGCQTR